MIAGVGVSLIPASVFRSSSGSPEWRTGSLTGYFFYPASGDAGSPLLRGRRSSIQATLKTTYYLKDASYANH